MGSSGLTASCDCETSCTPGCSPTDGSPNEVPNASKMALGATGVTVTVCAACCVLPLAWPAIGLALTGSAIALLEQSQPWLTAISLIFVATAWGVVWNKSRKAVGRTNPANWAVLGGATVLLAIALCWRQIEPVLIAALD